ncbi:PilW family protein [Ectobacillus panaciterrae]|uniref:PilW family protein n=1 Tax=Ectobacillus panaciterrae TaxID=363872 RepID=UPI0004275728|nr:prepilin-type N-terminal cleavage/methylation domain-containing protein [Ectobacillus panaciterrae]
MNRFANLVKNERGVTMIELLGTLVIVSVIAGSMYSVFTMGLKTYQKTTMEAKLRDEADYVVSMIMNQLYSSDYDDVKYNETTQTLEFYKRKSDKPLFQKDDVTYEYNNSTAPAARLRIENGEMLFQELNEKGEPTKTHSFTQDNSIKLKTGSELDMVCTRQGTIFPRVNHELEPLNICKSGILQLTFVFEAQHTNLAPLAVTSEIGF